MGGADPNTYVRAGTSASPDDTTRIEFDGFNMTFLSVHRIVF
jgi:hypothetical protein